MFGVTQLRGYEKFLLFTIKVVQFAFMEVWVSKEIVPCYTKSNNNFQYSNKTDIDVLSAYMTQVALRRDNGWSPGTA